MSKCLSLLKIARTEQGVFVLNTGLIEYVELNSDIAYQVAMALHPHFQCSLISDAHNHFYQFTSESARHKIKTKMIGMINLC